MFLCSVGNEQLSLVATAIISIIRSQQGEKTISALKYPPCSVDPHIHTQSEEIRGKSSMLSKVLPLLALVYAASAFNVEDKNKTDFECFKDAFPDYNTTTINNSSSFDVRIEHSGSLFNIGDWFDSGEVHTIKEGEVYMYNTTAKAMSEICEVVGAFDGDWCNGTMTEIGNIERFLVVGFDGNNLLAAMNKMMVNVTKTEATYGWDGCKTMDQTAAQDMNKVEFTYVHWDTSAVTGDFPDWWSPEDKLLLSGASSTIASIVTLLVSLLATTRLF